MKVKSIKVVAKRIKQNEKVYDITVRKNHNFFANGILVSNCAEIALRPFQFCNLCEINASDVESQEDLNRRVKAAALIGTLQAGYTNFHYLRAEWQRTTEKEALIGVGMTGIGSGKVQKYNLTEAAKVVNAENKRVAKLIGIKSAARTTTVKPSGTSSLVLGTSSGIHAWHNRYYIRRIRVGKNESIYQHLAAYHPELIEDDYFRPHDTAVIKIPQMAPDGSIYRTETPIDLLKRVKHFYSEWIKPGHISGQNTHNISATVSVKNDEWDLVGEWMWNYKRFYNGLSVLPYDGGTYIQPPFEDCDAETYHRMMHHLKEVDLTKVLEFEDLTDLKGELACVGNSCTIEQL